MKKRPLPVDVRRSLIINDVRALHLLETRLRDEVLSTSLLA